MTDQSTGHCPCKSIWSMSGVRKIWRCAATTWICWNASPLTLRNYELFLSLLLFSFQFFLGRIFLKPWKKAISINNNLKTLRVTKKFFFVGFWKWKEKQNNLSSKCAVVVISIPGTWKNLFADKAPFFFIVFLSWK